MSFLFSPYRSGRKDGKDALPGAVECLEELRRQGKRLVVLSNTSKREAFTMDRLPKFGFRSELFDGGVTSGEVTLARARCRGTSLHDVCVPTAVCDVRTALFLSFCHAWCGG